MPAPLELDPSFLPGDNPNPAPRRRWLRWVLLLLLAGGVTLYLVNRQDPQFARDSEESLKRVKNLLQAFPAYDTSKDYYEKLAEAAHPKAFAAAYDTKTKMVDAEKYNLLLLEAMSEQARKDKREDIARPVAALLDIIKSKKPKSP